MSRVSTPDELKTRAESYSQGLLVKYVGMGAGFIAALDESERDLLVSFLMETYCQGALDALKELQP